MAGKFIDIAEGHCVLYNPLPKLTVGELNVLLDWYDDKADPNAEVFMFETVYAPTGLTDEGFGARKEIRLAPGEKIKIISYAAKELRNQCPIEETGLVIVDDESDLPRASVAALAEFKKHLDQRGIEQIRKFQQRHRLRDDEVQGEKALLIGYFRNAEKAKVVDAHRRDLEAQLKKAAAKKQSSAEV